MFLVIPTVIFFVSFAIWCWAEEDGFPLWVSVPLEISSSRFWLFYPGLLNRGSNPISIKLQQQMNTFDLTWLDLTACLTEPSHYEGALILKGFFRFLHLFLKEEPSPKGSLWNQKWFLYASKTFSATSIFKCRSGYPGDSKAVSGLSVCHDILGCQTHLHSFDWGALSSKTAEQWNVFRNILIVALRMLKV